jgi:formate hydrogenlyase subunit 3/multisubunit Na+/H+ antiporter MnhD subunit
MYGAILAAYFFLMFYLNYNIYPVIFLGILSVVLICVLAILGILEHNIRKFLIYSNIIQSTFVFLDLSVAQLTGKISVLGTIQIFNYVIAGVLLFLTLGILTENGKRKSFSSLQGFYYKYKLNASFSIIAAISLAGVPGLNIFVSEWLLFKTSFGINPIITIWGIFAALLLFIMYFKIVYYLLSGEVLKKEKSPVLLKVYNGGLALFCLIFGLLPFTQIYLLEGVL